MVRGRKRDATAPLTRSLVLQRDYRARKAQYVADLEAKVRRYAEQNEKLLKEVEDLRKELYRREGLVYEADAGKARALASVLNHLSLASTSIQHFQDKIFKSQHSDTHIKHDRSAPNSPASLLHTVSAPSGSSIASTSSVPSSSRSSTDPSPENQPFELMPVASISHPPTSNHSPLSTPEELSRSPSQHSDSYSPDEGPYWGNPNSRMSVSEEDGQVFHAVGLVDDTAPPIPLPHPQQYHSEAIHRSNGRYMSGQSSIRTTTTHSQQLFPPLEPNNLPPLPQSAMLGPPDMMRHASANRYMMHHPDPRSSTWN
ncbi:hypothetical protein D9758_004351 [Tetrapyrgos nigripes]|uniref:BZIP domain-containing protein n=1 Tax=Tetrapyrgos nigripes TaxID=182062 RepID=A0A8H5LSI4_9AGAR|nr:hypothetical protein D9758_004351 [Tetrapyrgos nigripes]